MSTSLLSPEQLTLLRQEYDAADKILREVTEFVDEAGIPAINELRYAGYHLLNAAVPATGSVSTTDELTRAINHCKRASYEASEAGILSAFDRIKDFKTEFADLPISDVVTDWLAQLTVCDSLRDRIAAARASEEDRSKDHSVLRDAFRQLVTFCRTLDHARDELNKRRKAEQKESRRFVLNTILAVLGLAVAILLGVLAL